MDWRGQAAQPTTRVCLIRLDPAASLPQTSRSGVRLDRTPRDQNRVIADRYDIMDREFPVRLSVRANPETNELTRQWLQRHVGKGNYGSRPHTLWSSQKAHCIYFRSLHVATNFILGCPHIQLVGELYRGSHR